MERWTNVCLTIISGVALFIATHWPKSEPVVLTPAPAPAPRPEPEPKKPRRPILPWREDAVPSPEVVAAAQPGAGPGAALSCLMFGASPLGPDGAEPQIDFPDGEWMKNIGSRLDGAGMCVFTSFEHSARWAGLEEFRGFRDWCAQRYPGGGFPEKLQKLIDAYCKAKGITPPTVIQYEGESTAVIEAALKQGLLPCNTLYSSPRYGRGTIYHMTNIAHLDEKSGAILDNNFKPLEWADRQTTVGRMKLRGKLWCVVLVAAGPPPFPQN